MKNKGVAGEYENQHWLDNWLRLKVAQEQKEFNDLTREEAKKNIRTLTFVQLDLKGQAVIENFPDLTQLNLSNNDLEEIIIRNCPDLKLVQVAHNKLTKLKIENCPSVKELYTSYNQLTNLEEAKIEELNNLLIFSYDQNPLTGEEKARLDAFGLKDTAAKARVDGPAQEWLDDKYPLDIRDSIEKLDLSELGLQGDLDLTSFTNLKQLDCSGNELTDLEINGCQKLEYLDCSNNLLWRLDASNNKELQEISANHNEIWNADFTGLDKLHTLMLTSNHLEEINLSGLPNLLHLNVGLNSLKSLDLKENLKLQHLYCYKNSDLTELEVKHLTDLESLYCYRCTIKELDCGGLDKLEELNCANLLILKKLLVDECVSLKNLDCAENPGLKSLTISNLPQLDSVSIKESGLENLKIKNCPNLGFLDLSKQLTFIFSGISIKDLLLINTEITIDEITANNLRELYYTKNLVKGIPDENQMPKLEMVGIGEKRRVKDKDGKDELCYFVDEIDMLAIRNTKRIQNILANPKNYSFADLFNLKGKKLHGVSTELREKLFELATKKANEELLKKLREQFFGKDKDPEDSGDENPNSNPPTEEPSEVPTPQEPEEPTPPNKDQIIRDLEKKNEELEARLRELESGKPTSQQARDAEIEKIREEIINSDLDENKKQELLNLLEEITKKTTTNEVEISPSTPLYYWGWLFVIVGWIVLAGLFILSLRKEKKRRY